MADVLSQSQIDELLKSMQGGGGAASSAPAPVEQKVAVQEEKKQPGQWCIPGYDGYYGNGGPGAALL